MIEDDRMNGSRQTEDLIRDFAREAGLRKRNALPFDRALSLGIAASLLSALAIVIGVFGVRPDLAAAASTGMFHFKIAATIMLALGGLCLVRFTARPGSSWLGVLALMPGLLLLLAGVAFDRSGFPILGGRAISVPSCVGAIVLASLPALLLLLAALKRGIPTRLALSGASVGMLAGSLGAVAYTLACVNDGALFVAVWYGLAILIMTAIGAAAGERVLAW